MTCSLSPSGQKLVQGAVHVGNKLFTGIFRDGLSGLTNFYTHSKIHIKGRNRRNNAPPVVLSPPARRSGRKYLDHLDHLAAHEFRIQKCFLRAAYGRHARVGLPHPPAENGYKPTPRIALKSACTPDLAAYLLPRKTTGPASTFLLINFIGSKGPHPIGVTQ